MTKEVTIVIPVYIRTKYFRFALDSALRQTVPVKIIVHDASPSDEGFLKLIGRDADKVTYYRAPDNPGMAGNWTRCLRICDTEWVSILHEDDILTDDAIKLLLQAKAERPDHALYFGLEDMMDERGVIYVSKYRRADGALVEISPLDYALANQFYFPGALVNRAAALELGGFRTGIRLTPDWDLWVRLALHGGALRINRQTATFREHFDQLRGTSIHERTGGSLVRTSVQRKRNLARLRERFLGTAIPAEVEMLTPRMARSLLISKGKSLTPQGRRIGFAYATRLITGRKTALGWTQTLAHAICWFWWLLSYLWPFYMKLWPYYWPPRNWIARQLRKLSAQKAG